MAKPTTLFLGLDVYKDFITVAHVEAPCFTTSRRMSIRQPGSRCQCSPTLPRPKAGTAS